jgi:hypothetical protein
MNNLNNLLNGNEFVFRVPFDYTTNIFDTIENMLNELHNNTNIMNAITTVNQDEEYVHFDIYFDESNDNQYDENHDYEHNGHPMHFHLHQIEYENNYFKSCHEINEKLKKSEKIKKCDSILNENCFICMDNYKESQLKRELPSCKHYFHKKCIDKWLKKKASYPICRDELLK